MLLHLCSVETMKQPKSNKKAKHERRTGTTATSSASEFIALEVSCEMRSSIRDTNETLRMNGDRGACCFDKQINEITT